MPCVGVSKGRVMGTPGAMLLCRLPCRTEEEIERKEAVFAFVCANDDGLVSGCVLAHANLLDFVIDRALTFLETCP